MTAHHGVRLAATVAAGAVMLAGLLTVACKSERVQEVGVDLGYGNAGGGLSCEGVPGDPKTAILLRGCTDWQSQSDAGDPWCSDALKSCLDQCDNAAAQGLPVSSLDKCFSADLPAKLRELFDAGGALATVPSQCDQSRKMGLASCFCTTVTFAVFIDFVDVPGYPGCRTTELQNACAHTGDCLSQPGSMACRAITLTLTLAQQKDWNDRAVRAGVLNAVRDQLRGFQLTADAPDRPVIIHLVARAKTCDGGVTLPVGCAYSCPVVLTNGADPVHVDLDTPGTCTASDVEQCSRLGNGLPWPPLESD